jgi:outer membrane protein
MEIKYCLYTIRKYLILMVFLLPGAIASYAQLPQEEVIVGVLVDGSPLGYEKEINELREEIDLILGAVYEVEIPEEYIRGSEGKKQQAEVNYQQLVEDPKVDIIVCLGILTGSVIGQKTDFPKPVILFGVEDPVLQGISSSFRHTSGVHNLTYIVTTESFERDLFVFHQLFPFKNLGVVLAPELVEVLPLSSPLLDSLTRNEDFDMTILPIKGGIEEFIDSISPEIDAIYVGYHSEVFNMDELKLLFQEMGDKKIPTFTSNPDFVKLGALASNTPDPNISKVMRRIVLNIESILEGVDPAELPVILSVEEKLTINVKVLRKLDYAPSYEVLSQAELINQFEYETERHLSLLDVLLEVQQSNIELRANRQGVQSALQDVNIERAGFLPFGRVVASQAYIDQAQVEFASEEGLTEFVTTAILSLEQLIYSEQVMSSYVVQKHLFDAAGNQYNSLKLDIILEAGESYFEILRSQNVLKVARDNLELTQENRDLAEARESVGYSDPSDVYRWEANLAQATSTVIQAQTALELSKIRLNLLLNRPYTETFQVEEAGLTDSLVNVYFDERLQQYLYDPKSLSVFSDFLVEEGIRNSPTIKSIDEQLKAQHRFLKANRRQRYIPETSFVADFFFTVLRGGAGTEGIIVPGTPPITIDPEFPPSFTYVLSVNASLPFLQGGRIHYISQQAKIEIDRLQEERRLEILRIQERVSASLLDATVNAFNLELTQRAARFANRAYSMVKTSYSNGQSLFVDLLNAQNEAIRANLDASNAVYDYLISLLRVDRAISSFAILRDAEQERAMQRRFEQFFVEKPNLKER